MSAAKEQEVVFNRKPARLAKWTRKFPHKYTQKWQKMILRQTCSVFHWPMEWMDSTRLALTCRLSGQTVKSLLSTCVQIWSRLKWAQVNASARKGPASRPYFLICVYLRQGFKYLQSHRYPHLLWVTATAAVPAEATWWLSFSSQLMLNWRFRKIWRGTAYFLHNYATIIESDWRASCRTRTTHLGRQIRRTRHKIFHFFTFYNLMSFLELYIPFCEYFIPSLVKKITQL